MNLFLALVLAATLPMPGTKLKDLPSGKAKADVEAACYQCHAADLLVQQRLTQKQWTATVEKMMRWGAVVPAEKKTPIVEYLARNFGPSRKFEATKVGAVRK
ncbi:MAG TPA: hypothetical protein VGQ76_21760 [Thermoanaerobaculia bacterium]|jgi:hypothetical protein|nr:hypothetical protein [Thermoanaerobaculia bacterium]